MNVPRIMTFPPSPLPHHLPVKNRPLQHQTDNSNYANYSPYQRNSSASVNASLTNLLQVDNDTLLPTTPVSCTTPRGPSFRATSIESPPENLHSSESFLSGRVIRKPSAVDVDVATNESANSIPTPTSDTSQQATAEQKQLSIEVAADDAESVLSEPRRDATHSPQFGHDRDDVSEEHSAGSETCSRPGSATELKCKRMLPFEDVRVDRADVASRNMYERTLSPNVYRGPRPPTKTPLGTKGILLGHWRNSKAPDEDKHAVIGFIDVRDRLRTRIQSSSKRGEDLSTKYPLPTGPGSSWVTFDKICFSDHLVGLDHFQIKEYVRIRSGASNETEQEAVEAETQAINEAIQRGRKFSMLESSGKPLMAYGAEVPIPGKPRDSKRRRTSDVSQEEVNSNELQVLPSRTLKPLDPLHGTRPTKIPLGYWKGSSEEELVNKHAVVGILGQNNMFRVKVLRETRDGHYVDGNFPSGAGALWIHYDEVQLEPHLQNLTRLEVKEYCRVRQYQLDRGEDWKDRAEHEAKAVEDARTRTSHGLWQPAHLVRSSADSDNEHRIQSSGFVSTINVKDSIRKQSSGAQSSRHGVDPRSAQSTQLSRDESKSTVLQGRHDRAYTVQEAEDMPLASQNYTYNVSPLPGDAKVYDGVRYERKPHGPFIGKLVSRGHIINIDGEDYVEYRVLTKPAF